MRCDMFGKGPAWLQGNSHREIREKLERKVLQYSRQEKVMAWTRRGKVDMVRRASRIEGTIHLQCLLNSYDVFISLQILEL